MDELEALKAERTEAVYRLKQEQEKTKQLESCVDELKEELERKSERVYFLEGQLEVFKFLMEHTRRC